MCHQGIGHGNGEPRIALPVKCVRQQVQFEDAVVRGAEQDGIVLQQSGGLDDAVVSHHSRLHRRIEWNELLRLGVVERHVTIAR